MLTSLMIGLPVMMVCLLLQALLCASALSYYAGKQSLIDDPRVRSSILVITGVMFILVLGNVAQFVIWGVLFWLLGEFELLSDAVYHSAVNFATLGYGDIVMSRQHRMLGPIEAINGVLMIGISTAALTATFHDAIRRTRNARSVTPPG